MLHLYMYKYVCYILMNDINFFSVYIYTV